MTASSELVELLAAVSRIPKGAGYAFDHPAFVALREWARRVCPNARSKDGLSFALSHALDRLNLSPSTRRADASINEITQAAERLAQALSAKRIWRTHLCPLDMADELPNLAFGPNWVGSLSLEELQSVFAPLGGQAPEVDARFAQFQWLLVREEVFLDKEPGQRAFPLLFDLSGDFAEIQPHARRFPEAVERALFALLLTPWEDLGDHTDLDWRAFELRWAYTIDEDLFVRAPSLPSPDTLTWVPHHQTMDDGEAVEFERPGAHLWGGLVMGVEPWITDARWTHIEAALNSNLFSTPIGHFLVAAFMGTGIDEFIAHLTALEAALGLRKDQAREKTMSKRIEVLLNDPAAGETYGWLFNLRSEYVHGRVMTAISGADRTEARRLARRVTEALMQRAQMTIADRESFLLTLAPHRPSKSAAASALTGRSAPP